MGAAQENRAPGQQENQRKLLQGKLVGCQKTILLSALTIIPIPSSITN